jgi:hypothetical protein
MESEEIIEMFCIYFPNSSDKIDLIKDYAERKRLSAADWQNIFMKYSSDVNILLDFIKQEFSSSQISLEEKINEETKLLMEYK